jgi:hypothetical protein
MRLEDIEKEPYKLYKTADELVDEFNEENEIDNDSLDKIYMEYRELENENIVRKRKAFKMINKFTEELDKINKYPSLDFSSSDNNSLFIYTQIYLLVMSVLFLFALFYFKTILAFILFPVALYIGDQYGIIEKVEY